MVGDISLGEHGDASKSDSSEAPEARKNANVSLRHVVREGGSETDGSVNVGESSKCESGRNEDDSNCNDQEDMDNGNNIEGFLGESLGERDGNRSRRSSSEDYGQGGGQSGRGTIVRLLAERDDLLRCETLNNLFILLYD